MNTCAITSTQESILDSVKNRDGDALVKQIREINSRIGNGCPIGLMWLAPKGGLCDSPDFLV